MTDTVENGRDTPPSASGQQQPVVVVSSLDYAVGRSRILHDISFSVMPGEIFGIMGMSGSGKTTLLRLLMALIRPTAGSIVIHGEEITELDEDGLNRVRSNMGMCFQYAALFDSLTVAENVAFALRNKKGLSREDLRRRVDELLDIVDMEGTAEKMPADLSGGMKKRVGIARALMAQPALMLYDEPTSGLDPVMAGIITELIRQVRDEFRSTAIVVSHDVGSLFSIADRVLMMHAGRVVAIGTPDDMRASELPTVKQFVSGDASGPLTESMSPR